MLSVYIECMYSPALDDNNCIFYDGSSVSAQDLLGPVSSIAYLQFSEGFHAVIILVTNLENK